MSLILPKNKWIRVFLGVFMGWFLFFSLPSPLFDYPMSSILLSREGELLQAQIASDEQWRIPLKNGVPDKLKTCIITFEDEYFRWHWGVNPLSTLKALIGNVKSGSIRRGGSTITMQVIRLARKNPPRTIPEKLYEMFLATRLECTYMKKTILELYASYAPFGGNIVGAETASWRYFGRSLDKLSWAESATLAVLPNAPSLIFPGKNQEKLLNKRNKLLLKLKENGELSENDYQLALLERLPDKWYSIPNKAYHLLSSLNSIRLDDNRQTTINYEMQQIVNKLILNHYQNNVGNSIHHMAAMVISTQTGEILAYVGNSPDSSEGSMIDMVMSSRSSGSTLKPLLYQSMLSQGLLHATYQLSDVPMDIDGYEPMNNSKEYDGIVGAQEALVRSLNIPWILSLRRFGYEKFYHQLKKSGFNHFTKPPKHYGLSMVVGGGNITMLELANAYFNMANAASGTSPKPIRITKNDVLIQPPIYIPDKASSWLTLSALTKVIRPENEAGWYHRESQKIAWKTGTSHGFKDAWAVGINPSYTIVVWAGNADGTGRPGLTGIRIAAPLLFDILSSLPNKHLKWWAKPQSEIKKIKICKHSGRIPNSFCTEITESEIPKNSSFTEICSFHKEILLNAEGTARVNASCYSPNMFTKKVFFELPPLEMYYYSIKNPYTASIPGYLAGCTEPTKGEMQLLSPMPNVKIILPEKDAPTSIFKAYHTHPNAKIFWHIDNQFIQATQGEHKIQVPLKSGIHTISIQDEYGGRISRKFEVVE